MVATLRNFLFPKNQFGMDTPSHHLPKAVPHRLQRGIGAKPRFWCSGRDKGFSNFGRLVAI